MKAKVVWAKAVWEVFEELPKKETAEIVERVNLLRYFPHIYPLRTRGRFRGLPRHLSRRKAQVELRRRRCVPHPGRLLRLPQMVSRFVSIYPD